MSNSGLKELEIRRCVIQDPDVNQWFKTRWDTKEELRKDFLTYQKYHQEDYEFLNYQNVAKLMRTSRSSILFLHYLEGGPNFNFDEYIEELWSSPALMSDTTIARGVLYEFLNAMFYADAEPGSVVHQFDQWLVGEAHFPTLEQVQSLNDHLEESNANINKLYWVMLKYHYPDIPNPPGARGRTRVKSHCPWKVHQIQARAPGVEIDVKSTEEKHRHEDCDITNCKFVKEDKEEESKRVLGCLCYGKRKCHLIDMKNQHGEEHYEFGICLFNLETCRYDQYEGRKYAAISHCWGQFLFTDGRRVLSCVIEDLKAQLIPLGIQHVWTDVWCLYQPPKSESVDDKESKSHHSAKPKTKLTPEQEAAKEKGLDLMTKIYEDADYVLVYDTTPYLSTAICGSSTWFLNNALGAWNERIWTLQEAALSDNVYFMGRLAIGASALFPFAYMPMTGRAGMVWISLLWHTLPSSQLQSLPSDIRKDFDFDQIIRLCAGRFSSRKEDQWRGTCGLLKIKTLPKTSSMEQVLEHIIRHIESIDESLVFSYGLHTTILGATWLPLEHSTAIYEIYHITGRRALISLEGAHVEGSLYTLGRKIERVSRDFLTTDTPGRQPGRSTYFDLWFTSESVPILLETQSDAVEKDVVLASTSAHAKHKTVWLIGKLNGNKFVARAGIYGALYHDNFRTKETKVIIGGC